MGTVGLGAPGAVRVKHAAAVTEVRQLDPSLPPRHTPSAAQPPRERKAWPNCTFKKLHNFGAFTWN